MTRVHICRFSSLDELGPRQRKNPRAVLAALAKAKRFSAFEMDAALGGTVSGLKDGGFITTDISCGFPWTKVEITPAGQALLDGKQP